MVLLYQRSQSDWGSRNDESRSDTFGLSIDEVAGVYNVIVNFSLYVPVRYSGRDELSYKFY